MIGCKILPPRLGQLLLLDLDPTPVDLDDLGGLPLHAYQLSSAAKACKFKSGHSKLFIYAANGNVQNLDLCVEVARRGHNQDTDLELPMGYSLAVCPSEDCHNGQTGGSFQSGGIFVRLVSLHTLL